MTLCLVDIEMLILYSNFWIQKETECKNDLFPTDYRRYITENDTNTVVGAHKYFLLAA